MLNRFYQDESGATIVEYGIIATFIGVPVLFIGLAIGIIILVC